MLLEKEVETKITDVAVYADECVVTNEKEFIKACEALTIIKQLQDKVDEVFDPVVSAANRAHREAIDAKKKVRDPLNIAELHLNNKIKPYRFEMERRQREKEKEIEAALKKQEEESIMAMALEAENAGAHDAAENIIGRTVVPMPVILGSPTPKTNVSFTKRWSAHVYDLTALIRAVAEGKVHQTVIEPNMPELNKIAAALKGNMNIPGVRAVETTGTSTRR